MDRGCRDRARRRARVASEHRHWCAVIATDGRARVVVQVGDIRQEVASAAVSTERLTLRLGAVSPQSAPLPFEYAGPDDITLSADAGKGFIRLARLDGRYFSTEVAAGFAGRMLAFGSPAIGGRLMSGAYTPEKA